MNNQDNPFKDYEERAYSQARMGFNSMSDDELLLLRRQYGNKGSVMCVPSPYSLAYEDKSILSGHKIFNIKKLETKSVSRNTVYIDFDHEDTYFDIIINSLISDKTSLPLLHSPFLSNYFLAESIERVNAEYNPSLWQLVVCGVVICEDGVVMLKNNDTHPRLPNKVTLVQGHVDAHKDMHMMSSKRFLMKEFVREIVEELNVPDLNESELLNLCDVAGAIQLNVDIVSMEHLGIFCVLDLRGKGIKSNQITSNEPDKHNTITYTKMDDILEEGDNLDSWVKIVSLYFLSGKYIQSSKMSKSLMEEYE